MNPNDPHVKKKPITLTMEKSEVLTALQKELEKKKKELVIRTKKAAAEDAEAKTAVMKKYKEWWHDKFQKEGGKFLRMGPEELYAVLYEGNNNGALCPLSKAIGDAPSLSYRDRHSTSYDKSMCESIIARLERRIRFVNSTRSFRIAEHRYDEFVKGVF